MSFSSDQMTTLSQESDFSDSRWWRGGAAWRWLSMTGRAADGTNGGWEEWGVRRNARRCVTLTVSLELCTADRRGEQEGSRDIPALIGQTMWRRVSSPYPGSYQPFPGCHGCRGCLAWLQSMPPTHTRIPARPTVNWEDLLETSSSSKNQSQRAIQRACIIFC